MVRIGEPAPKSMVRIEEPAPLVAGGRVAGLLVVAPMFGGRAAALRKSRPPLMLRLLFTLTALPVAQAPPVCVAPAEHRRVASGVAVLARVRRGPLASVLLVLRPSGALGPRTARPVPLALAVVGRLCGVAPSGPPRWRAAQQAGQW